MRRAGEAALEDTAPRDRNAKQITPVAMARSAKIEISPFFFTYIDPRCGHSHKGYPTKETSASPSDPYDAIEAAFRLFSALERE
jgi:hypothetical protein